MLELVTPTWFTTFVTLLADTTRAAHDSTKQLRGLSTNEVTCEMEITAQTIFESSSNKNGFECGKVL